MNILLKIKDIIKLRITKFIFESKNINQIGIRNYLKNQWRVVLVILITIISLVLILTSNKTQADILKDLNIALKENKPYKILSSLEFEGRNMKVSEITSLTKYYSNNDELVDGIIKNLKTNGKSGFFEIKSKNNIFRETYYIKLNPLKVKIESNFEPSSLRLNNKDINKKGITRGLIPGVYNINAKLNTPYGIITVEEEIVLLQDKTIKLNFPATKITIASNFIDAMVYINNINTNLTVDRIKDYGPIPTNKNIEVFLKKDFPWGEVKSETYKVTDIPLINIPLDGINSKAKGQMESAVTDMLNSAFEALNMGDYKTITNCTEEAKSKIYNELNVNSIFFKNNYEISELKSQIQEGELTQEEGLYKSQVLVKVNYNVYKKILPFIKKPKELKIIVDLSYNNFKWNIIDIQSISY